MKKEATDFKQYRVWSEEKEETIISKINKGQTRTAENMQQVKVLAAIQATPRSCPLISTCMCCDN